MKKTFLWMAAAIMTCGLAFTACTVEDNPNPNPMGEPDPDEWEIDFYALSQKYADKVGLTITAAIYDNVGTTSIVNGKLQEPAEDGSETASEELDQRFGVQTGTSWFFYTNHGKTGLYQGNGGGRTFGVFDVKKNQTISIEVTEEPSIKSGSAELMSKTDSSYTYFVSEDCNVVFNLARYNVISKISVQYFYSADYTVKFVNEKGEKIKDDVVYQGIAGKAVELWPSAIAPIVTETGKYIFKEADNTAENVVKKDGSTVVTVVFRDAEKYYVVLNCMAGNTLLNQFKDEDKYWFYEGDSYTIYPPRGYTKDGSTYMTPSNNNLKNGKPQYNCVEVVFPGSITPKATGGKTYYIATLNYEKDENIVYYSEAERLALPTEDAGNGVGLGQLFGTVNSWYSFSGGVFNRFSGARGIRLDIDSYIWTEPIATAGTYNVKVYGRNDANDDANPPYVLGIKTGDDIQWLTNLTIPSWGKAATTENVVENVNIPAGSSLVIKNDDAAKQISLDDITISKPAAAE
jgi:hypothetical protein